MKVAGYIRVSTDEQVKEGYSLEAQRDSLISFCKSQRWELVETYVEEGKSAKDLNRPEVKRLLSDAWDGRYDVLLVYRLDRLTRSVKDLYELLQTFEKCGLSFKSVTEVYDTTTAMGKLFITIVAALAQWERENLSERVRFGMEGLVREGKWHGGPVPFGYKWDGETMQIVPEECMILRELRRIYMSGEGFGSTSRTLNDRGLKRWTSKIRGRRKKVIESRKRREIKVNGLKLIRPARRRQSWSSYTVWYVLDNPFYAGKVRYGSKKKNGKYANRKKENQVEVIWSDTGFPTIFSWEEYVEHTDRMKRKEFFGHAKKREYRFTGVLRCARCGATLIGRPYTNKRKDGTKLVPHYNYICSNRSMRSGCELPLLRQEIVEKLIMDQIEKIRVDHQEMSNFEDNNKSLDVENELDRLQKEIRSINERRKKWQYMFAEDLMSAEDLRERKKEEDDRERDAKGRIDEIKASAAGTDHAILQRALELPELWSSMNDADRRELMQILFKRIVIECEAKTGKGAGKGRSLPFYIKEFEFN